MQIRWGKGKALVLVLMSVALMLGCFWGDDEEDEVTVDDRIGNIEAQLTGFGAYLAAQQALLDEQQQRSVVVEVSDDEGEIVSTTAYIAPPLYSLKKGEASENEIEIVQWMADCAARTYLNPDLPEEVVEREVAVSEERMWTALESGQYSSFENYIGMAFNFCHARIVQEEDGE